MSKIKVAKKSIIWACILGAVFFSQTACEDINTDPEWNVIEPWIGDGKFSILVDSIHQWEARPDFVLDEYEFRYCHSQSTNRLLANLTHHNFKHRQIREGKLDYDTLKKHDVLLINVPTRRHGSRSKPDRKLLGISDDEVSAITRFVEEGGGLFVVGEHNNAYDSAAVLNPLLKNFGIKIPSAYAREKPLTRNTIGKNAILIRISNYSDHPITRKVRETSWMGGGPLETEHGVAFLSENGHADLGDYITSEPMKHANGRVDDGEVTGPGIPVIAAVQKGKGRVVVIGDHNTLGVQWLGIADNYRFAMNVFAWLSKREDEKPHIADAPPIGIKIGWDLSHTDWAPGLRDRRGFHPAFINFSREPMLFTLGLLELDEPADVLLLADPEKKYSSDDISIITKRLSKGERVILLADPAEPRKGTKQLLTHFLPELVLKTPQGNITPQVMFPGRFKQAPRIEQALPIESEFLLLPANLEAAALDPRKTRNGRYDRPKDLKNSVEYLLDVYTDQGAPFISAVAPDGHDVTIARRFAVGGGEILLFVQAKMWSNLTFGRMRDEPDVDAAYGSHELQLAFARWLATVPPIVDKAKGKLEAALSEDTEATPSESNI